VFELDGVNYSYAGIQVSRDNDVFYINVSDLAAGSHSYRWYANDSKGNWTDGGSQVYSVVNATPVLTLSLDSDSTSSYF